MSPYRSSRKRFLLATRLTERAELAGAVNTLRFDPYEVIGDNTDGVRPLARTSPRNLGFPVAGKRVLLLGAGGAARGRHRPLCSRRRRRPLIIANRTVAACQGASPEHFVGLGRIDGCGYGDLQGRVPSISSSTRPRPESSGELPLLPQGLFAPGSLAYKMMYGIVDSPFRAFALAQGRRQFRRRALGMLVEQAAESFRVLARYSPRQRTGARRPCAHA